MVKKSQSTQSEKNSLDAIIRRLSSDAVDTQILLDRLHLEQTARIIYDLKLAGLSLDDPIVESILPSGLRIKSQTIEAAIKRSQSRSARIGLDLTIGGRIVSTFFETAYGHEKTRYDRITIEIEAIPIEENINRKE